MAYSNSHKLMEGADNLDLIPCKTVNALECGFTFKIMKTDNVFSNVVWKTIKEYFFQNSINNSEEHVCSVYAKGLSK